MKHLLLLILILVFSGCAKAKLSEGGLLKLSVPFGGMYKDTFQTPYGIIKKGYTKKQVKKMLGESQLSITRDDVEIWYYSIDKDNRFFVNFIDGKVAGFDKPEDGKL